MRIALLAMTALAIAGCKKTETTSVNTTNDVAVENVVSGTNAAMTNAAAPEAVLTTLNETSWEYNRKGKDLLESVDATGKYIIVAGKEHFDHGTVVMKGGKACFTSAMTKDGESCWTNPPIAIGGSGETVNDKGEKLSLTRVAYTPLTM